MSGVNIISLLPTYFQGKRTDLQVGKKYKENLETVIPNTINLSAGLLEKLLFGLDYFDTWEDFSRYSKEFKLDQVLGDDHTSLNISRPELLKGFFQSKGTLSDLEFVLRTAGYNLKILDSNYYYKDCTICGAMLHRYHDTFKDIVINIGETKLLEALHKQWNGKDNSKEFSLDPKKYFSDIGISDPGPNQLDYIDKVLRAYIFTKDIPDNFYECSIIADISVDTESKYFDSMKLSRINAILTSIVQNRLSICAYLRDFSVALDINDRFVIRNSIQDSDLNDKESLNHGYDRAGLDTSIPDPITDVHHEALGSDNTGQYDTDYKYEYRVFIVDIVNPVGESVSYSYKINMVHDTITESGDGLKDYDLSRLRTDLELDIFGFNDGTIGEGKINYHKDTLKDYSMLSVGDRVYDNQSDLILTGKTGSSTMLDGTTNF